MVTSSTINPVSLFRKLKASVREKNLVCDDSHLANWSLWTCKGLIRNCFDLVYVATCF